jgi:CrcB protein
VSAAVVLAVGVVGGVGAIARLLLDGAVSERVGGGFPFGTLLVNVTGAFILGALFGAALDADAYRIAGTGLIGGFTTFSTWELESHRLGEDGQLRVGVLNFAISIGLGVAAAWAGRRLGMAL